MGALAPLVREPIRDLGNRTRNFKRRRQAAGSDEEAQQRAVGQQKRGRSSKQGPGSSGDHRRSARNEFRGHRGRHVATHAGDIVKVVPQMQKELFHGARLYGSDACTDVRVLTLVQRAQWLAGAFRRA